MIFKVGLCISELPVTIMKYVWDNLQRRSFILARGFGGSSPWSSDLWFWVSDKAAKDSGRV
jgi:hypothetical protein